MSAGRDLQAVEPEFATNWTSTWHSGNAHHDHLRLRASHKTVTDLLPEISILQVVAHEERSLAVKVLQGEPHATGTIHVARFIKGRELVRCVRFDGYHLADARIFDPRSIKDYA